MKKYLIMVVVLWLLMVFLAARFVPNWYVYSSYQDLITADAEKVLKQQADLRIEVFATPNSAAATLVNNFLEPLKAHLNNLTVEYIDILSNPSLVENYGITQQGEMVVHQAGQKFHLTTLSYEAFFNGLKRFDQPGEQWIVMFEQVNGKSFNQTDMTGLSSWLRSLHQANYRTVLLPFKAGLQLPKNVKLMVLPAPKKILLEEDINWLQQQLDQGVSLLWLADPASAIKQPALSLLFDVMRTDAYHQGHVVIKAFPNHPINQDFDRPLDLVEAMPYVNSDRVLWQNEQGETLASTRELAHSRLMVIGDSDFLSDSHLLSGGNLEMSFRVIDWLLYHDNRIDLPSIGVDGIQLHYLKSEILLFAILTLVVIPVLFLLISIWLWRKQKQ